MPDVRMMLIWQQCSLNCKVLLFFPPFPSGNIPHLTNYKMYLKITLGKELIHFKVLDFQDKCDDKRRITLSSSIRMCISDNTLEMDVGIQTP